MIRIIAGGKKNSEWVLEAVSEYEKRMRKPFDFEWFFMDEEKLDKYLADWPFSENISSPEFSKKLSNAFTNGRNVVILIGGAYGFSGEVRDKSDFVWSFSKLVFPHRIARVMVAEQIYRASQIAMGGPYHHE